MTEVSKKAIVLLLLVVLSTANITPLTVHANNKAATYIIYDHPTRFAVDFPLITALAEYLGHFGLTSQTLPLDAWRPGMLSQADIVVFVGLTDTALPQPLLQEIAQAGRVIWFERNIEQLAAYLQWQDFTLEGAVNGWSATHYQKELAIKDYMNIVITQPGQNARIFATVQNVNGSKPLAWQRDNIYFCGYLEFNEPHFMIMLADLLHEFIPGQQHLPGHQALLRIEDVSPLVNPKAVRAVVETIKQYRIPFAIGVIPVGVSQNGHQTPLHEVPELVAVLKEAQDNGASIIMHGYTHQNEYSPKTGEGYEFWNARDDKPMENDEAFTSERLEAGIAELVRCGLIPVAFEPPHYSMSKTGYQVLSRYFNVFSGVIQISDKSTLISLSLPFLTQSPYLNGMLVVPENMGYYDGKTFLVDAMLQNSERLLSIRDGCACFFYHGYLPPTKLPAIIEGVQKQGYTFFDLRQLPIRVQSSQIKIVGYNGQLQVAVDEELQASWKEAPLTKGLWQKLGFMHVIVLVIILIILLLIIIRLRVNRNRHYELNYAEPPQQ